MIKSSSRINKLVSECLAIEAESAKEAGMLAYMARAMVMATLPHSKPDGNVFQRVNGDFTLTMIGNPKFGLPYGSYPRILLAWMTREAKVKKSPVLELGKSFSAFLSTLKLSQSGGTRGDATRLREQMLKLFSTQVSCIYENRKQGVCKTDQFMITRSFELWWSPIQHENGEISKQSTIILAKDFFDELINRPVPIDLRMFQALRRSPLQMDIYGWLTYRFSYLKKSTLIPWNLLSNQFGSNYANNAQGLRDFKREFLRSLRIVTVMYKEANIEIQDEGIVLKKSRTHILSKKNRGDLA
ncbi:MAG: pirin [Gammaproteobacteria bacterium]|nr:pirin [Gammaproteobacteria bacterium]MCW5584246.1 pirin [Gammaproteobacteria bacterium]